MTCPMHGGSGGHGGDRRRLAALAGRDAGSLLDFSVNVRPEGPPEFIKAALWRGMDELSAYPSPRAEEAVDAAARCFGLPGDCWVFGNGSNEIIHALARVLRRVGRTRAVVLEPAFSEYRLACSKAGLRVEALFTGPESGFAPDPGKLAALPPGGVVFFANPANPSGVFLRPEFWLENMERRPDLLWIADEAFIDYVNEGTGEAGGKAGGEGAVSLLPGVAARRNLLVLRSLTKFYAVPGVRAGYAAGSPELARALRDELPAWSVNVFALATALAVFGDSERSGEDARAERRRNAERRADLCARLARVPGVKVFPSSANYVLFRCPKGRGNPAVRLLREAGIVLRDCANYPGLEDGTWFRAAVRLPEEHALLAEALTALLAEPGPERRILRRVRQAEARKPALMLQGTSSNAGKSVLAAAFCRILRQDGYDVAPFKAQNMSLNSGVTARGLEMGRAQMVQAQACGLEPDARMNPVLLKPQSETGSQIVLLGKPAGSVKAGEYFRARAQLWPTVRKSYDELVSEHEIMVLEGAGSPAEINLKRVDLVNMAMALYARAAVLLVGDIDRGGVYASFLGTWMTFTPEEKRRLAGFLVNRFRGEADLLAPAHAAMLAHTGVPVLGTVPYLHDLRLPDEDGFAREEAEEERKRVSSGGPQTGCRLDVAVILPGHVSNYTDFAPLELEPGVRVRPVQRVEEWGDPQLVILPGSKSVAADLETLRRNGLAERIRRHAEADKWILGICGGLQMLGRVIADPLGVESGAAALPGLGLLDLVTTFAPEKILLRVERAATPLGVESGGYEIHHGLTEAGDTALPLFRRLPDGDVCGYVTGRRWGTYLHGLFDNDVFRRAFVDHLFRDLGLAAAGGGLCRHDPDAELDRLAGVVREHVDVKAIYRSMGL